MGDNFIKYKCIDSSDGKKETPRDDRKIRLNNRDTGGWVNDRTLPRGIETNSWHRVTWLRTASFSVINSDSFCIISNPLRKVENEGQHIESCGLRFCIVLKLKKRICIFGEMAGYAVVRKKFC